MKYFAVLGRQPKISLAELESLFEDVRQIAPNLAEFKSVTPPELEHLGGCLKIAEVIDGSILDYLKTLPHDHKITLGVSDFARQATAKHTGQLALKFKHALVRDGYSVRVVPNKEALISSAASYHNRLGEDPWKVELLRLGNRYARVIAVQDIEAYVERDQARPARDAKVGMLPPKLAQILINLCGPRPDSAVLLDPFCGTGVLLQEALLMGYTALGSDLNERMVEYTERNLGWLNKQVINAPNSVSLSKSNPLRGRDFDPAQPANSSETFTTRPLQLFQITQGDATNHTWPQPIDAVACETYLGPPMSQPPAEIKLKEAKQECGSIILGFLKNLAKQLKPKTPVTIAVPAWLRPNGTYERLNLLDEIQNLGYNVESFRNLGQDDLLYHRDGQVVAREIIVLRKK